MISKEVLAELETTGRPYILGVRMRQTGEVREEVLADAGCSRVVHGPRKKSTDPFPLRVKEVRIEGRRYVVCVNADQAEHDRQQREEIVAGLREKLRQGDKSLVGNKGYRRYLRVEGPSHFVIDESRLAEESRYDGTWVLRTNTDLPVEQVALEYKKLWIVENWFCNCKSLVDTRPIFHHCDDTIRGHVFCSFLALLLQYELKARLKAKGQRFEWAHILADLIGCKPSR